jgi:hypothetical protein
MDEDGDGVESERGEPSEEGERTPRERAKRLATRLRFLRMRERTANFEDREAIRREIRRTEEELTRLAEGAGFDVDVGRDR